MPTTERIKLLEVEPDLAAGLSEKERRRIEPAAVFPAYRQDAGRLDSLDGATLLLLDGFVVRDVLLDDDRPASQVLGPGDLVDLDQDLLAADLPCRVDLHAATPIVAARVDGRLTTLCAHFPAMAEALRRRVADQATRTLMVAAVVALPRVEQRIVALLWILAGRWGTMASDGAVVPVALTHELLGRLVGSRRPTVTLALGRLEAEGLIERRDDGRVVLRRGSGDGLGDVGAEERGPLPIRADLVAEIARLRVDLP